MLSKTYTILAILLTFCSIGCTSERTAKTASVTDSLPTQKQMKDNIYPDLRDLALTTTAEKLSLSLPNDKTVVYGIVMDWGMDGNVVTTVAFLTGDASMYYSTGGGTIGGGPHEQISNLAKEYVRMGNDCLLYANKTEQTQLPKDDVVKFYLLTNNGLHMCQEEIKHFEDASSKLLPLFEKGNEVISELRNIKQK
jgi:hypothetical protein